MTIFARDGRFLPLADEQVATLDSDRAALYSTIAEAVHAVEQGDAIVTQAEQDVRTATENLRLVHVADRAQPQPSRIDLVRGMIAAGRRS